MDEPINILIVDDSRGTSTRSRRCSTPTAAGCVRAQSADEALLALLRARVRGDRARHPDARHERHRAGAGSSSSASAPQHVPILFLTAHMVDERDALRGYGVGAVDYLTKPINPEILRSKIAVFVELFAKTRALAARERRAPAGRGRAARRERCARGARRGAHGGGGARFAGRPRERGAPPPGARGSPGRSLGVRLRARRVPLVQRDVRSARVAGLDPRAVASSSSGWDCIPTTASRPTSPSRARSSGADRSSWSSASCVPTARRSGSAPPAPWTSAPTGRRSRRAASTRTSRRARRAEQALRESEKRLRVANEAAGLGTYIADLENDRLRYGPAMCQMLGSAARQREPLERASASCIRGRCHGCERRSRARSIPRPTAGCERSCACCAPDGEVRWCSYSAQLEFRETPSGRVPIYQVRRRLRHHRPQASGDRAAGGRSAQGRVPGHARPRAAQPARALCATASRSCGSPATTATRSSRSTR